MNHTETVHTKFPKIFHDVFLIQISTLTTLCTAHAWTKQIYVTPCFKHLSSSRLNWTVLLGWFKFTVRVTITGRVWVTQRPFHQQCMFRKFPEKKCKWNLIICWLMSESWRMSCPTHTLTCCQPYCTLYTLYDDTHGLNLPCVCVQFSADLPGHQSHTKHMTIKI
jgi:hypothetical protein